MGKKEYRGKERREGWSAIFVTGVVMWCGMVWCGVVWLVVVDDDGWGEHR